MEHFECTFVTSVTDRALSLKSYQLQVIGASRRHGMLAFDAINTTGNVAIAPGVLVVPVIMVRCRQRRSSSAQCSCVTI
jgi:hypothetical protein